MVAFGNLSGFLRDYFSPVQVGNVKSEEFLKYFPGGGLGVKRRFGDVFRRRLRAVSEKYLEELGYSVKDKFGPGILREIKKGDYRRMDSEVVNALSNAFLYDSSLGLGKLSIPDDEREGLLRKMRGSGFCSLGGTRIENGTLIHSNPHVSQDVLLNVYVALMALDEI